jgi:putative hydrolase of the HAD superfamily
MGGIDAVLFDLGGVLVDFGGVSRMRELAGIDNDDELWRRWLTCPWVRTFEKGQCSAGDFSTGVVATWELEMSPRSFLDEFRSWPRGPLPGAMELVTSLRGIVRLGCLSNTNALHWEGHVAQWPLIEEFEFRYLSFELGLVKPDRELFEEVAERLPVGRDRVLFLDDNLLNIEAALDAGFPARRVSGVDEAREALRSVGVLPPGRG